MSGSIVVGGIVEVLGERVHAVVHGDGPLVVCLGGVGGAWYDWQGVAADLARDHTVVCLDRPGAGLSGPATAPVELAREADRVAAVVDAVEAAHGRSWGGAVVAGHSFGGFIAEAFARLHAHRCDGVALIDSSVEEDPRPGRVSARRLARAQAVAGACAGAGPLLRRWADRVGPEVIGPADRRAAATLIYGDPRVARGIAAELVAYPHVAAQLAHLRTRLPLAAPVAVLAAQRHHGPATQWVRRQRHLADLLAWEVPTRFTVVRGAGHLVPMQRPDLVAAAVRAARA